MSKIALCVPCGDMVDAKFSMAYAMAVAYHACVHDDEIDQHYRQGTIIFEQRNTLCKLALENGADWIVFIDSDMTFPQDLVEQLTKHDKPVVAANCCKRRRPLSMTARKEREDDPTRLDPVWPDRAVTGLEQVHVVGTAIMAIKAEVLFQLPYPWFNQMWLPSEQRHVMEDVYFCGMLKKHDIPIYIDHDLSWEIGHVGQYVYEAKDALAERELGQAGLWDHMKETV